MSFFNCGNCGAELVFTGTDYYDFDVYKCQNPTCDHPTELSIPVDAYGADGDDESDDDYEDETFPADWGPE